MSESDQAGHADRPPLSDAEYKRLHMLEPEKIAELPEEQKQAYYRTHEWHFARRVSWQASSARVAACWAGRSPAGRSLPVGLEASVAPSPNKGSCPCVRPQLSIHGSASLLSF
jgi:hypothetical protein